MIQCDTFNGVTFTKSPLGLNRNRVTISSIQSVEIESMKSPTYSIKYALSGTEYYVLNGRRMTVSPGHYLIVNRERSFGTHFNSSRKVTGLCLHLEKSYLHDVYLQLTQTSSWLLDHPAEAFEDLQFRELLNSDKENGLGKFLQQIIPLVDTTALSLAAEENDFFYQLASQLLLNHYGNAVKGVKLQVQKSSTQKELLRRLATAKDLLEQEEYARLDITTLAKHCCLSRSHLFRCFKQVYGLSPNQYQLKRRLQKAAALLRANGMVASEVALHCGFADLPSFSKAFKKHFGLSPQQYRQSALCPC